MALAMPPESLPIWPKAIMATPETDPSVPTRVSAAPPNIMNPAIHLVSLGCSPIHLPSCSESLPNHSTARLSSGASAPARAALVLVSVPVAASHRFLSVPSWALTLVLRLACCCMRPRSSS